MDGYQLLLVCCAIALVAFLYSSVGHAGASGYIAVMSLFGFAAAVIRPTALILNVLVACIGTIQFWRAGHFSWKLFWPFALLSVPAAYAGGYLPVSPSLFKILLGAVLLVSAFRLFLHQQDPTQVHRPQWPTALSVGALIGFLAGLTGTGGGIFLTPLILFCRWGRTRQAAAVSVAFILVNSLAGLVGYVSSGQPLPPFAELLAVAAIGGGFLGSHFGSRRFPARVVQLLLAVVLLIAGLKLLLSL